jgi:hypothetical protein
VQGVEYEIASDQHVQVGMRLYRRAFGKYFSILPGVAPEHVVLNQCAGRFRSRDARRADVIQRIPAYNVMA